MATQIKRIGFGQVEPNHLSGIVTGQIYAQLPAANVEGEGAAAKKTPIAQLEQGQFAKYDYAAGVVHFEGDGEFMLVYNEEKLYDERKQAHKDFVYKATDFTDKFMYPRLIKTNIGDIFTTNTFGEANTSADTEVSTSVSLSVGDKLYVGDDGFLTTTQATDAIPVFKVVAETTMPDCVNKGVKIQRIQ